MDDYCVAPSGLIPPLPWTTFSPAFSHLQRGTLVTPFTDRIASGWGYDLHPGELSPTRASERLMRFLVDGG